MEQTQIFNFISAALSAKPDENKLVEEFYSLIEQEFAEFSREVNAMNDKAGMLLKLQRVAESFKMIATFPMIYGRKVGAVGGGFSSGKSAFINSFLPEDSIELVTGINPTTAIPTYVTSSKQNVSITGIPYNGSTFEISLDMFKMIDREFLTTLPFNLKNLIPYITISCPMDEKYFGKLCLIDTPGYNPASAGYSLEDYTTAVQHIANADFLIWLVTIEQGTLPKSDVKFLNQLAEEKKLQNLYVVVSKAELRPPSRIEGVLEQIRETLDDNNIKYRGICAYSSNMKKVYPSKITSKTMDIYQFLETCNIQTRTFADLNNSIDEVFNAYRDALNKQKNEYRTFQGLIKSIKLDMIPSTVTEEKDLSSINKSLAKLQKFFDGSNIEDHLRATEYLRKEFKDRIERLENYGIFSDITTLPQLEGYLLDVLKNNDLKAELTDGLKAQVVAIKMIYNFDFSPAQFKKIPEILGKSGKKYFNEIAVPVINVLAAHIKFQRSNRHDAEQLLIESCKTIAENVENLLNHFNDEKATFSGEKFFEDLLSKSIFEKTKERFDSRNLKDIMFNLMEIYHGFGG
jgi:hypothetical protein